MFLSTNNYVAGRTYCTYSRHYIVLRSTGQHTFGGEWQDCKTIPSAPTPTPTPFPTPTPTPTPCDPLGVLPCQTPTPTPTPTSTPQATISQFEVVEKYGTVDVNLSIINPTSVNTIVSFRTSSGSGIATFADGTAVKVYSGNQNVTLKIKGVTESAQLDGIFLDVKNNNVLLASEPFTVAVITSLTFERFDSDLDANPGNGQTGSEGGRRLFPDKTDPADGIDRAMVKVEAKVLPAVPSLKVYFGSFDLDDPSANVAPIDTNLSDGKDNNGAVSGSQSGDFAVLTGSSCENRVAGTAPNFVSTIQCSVEVGGTATAYFRTTMQPGDNFAIAATVDKIYRDGSIGVTTGMQVNPSDGSKIINAASQAITVSGEANPNSIAGIRTQMLTVWRKLHLEIDRMMNVTNNYSSGKFSATGYIPGNNAWVDVPVYSNNDLTDQGRFYGGWLVFGGNSLEVSLHTATTIRVRHPGSQPIEVRKGSTYTIYDDDDYNSDDGVTDGDQNEPINAIANILSGSYGNPYFGAYIALDTGWSPAYSQANVPFSTNVDHTSVTILSGLLNNYRNSSGDERDDFWIAYIVLAYQPGLNSDYDGYTNCNGNVCQSEAPWWGATLRFGQSCDCLNSASSCPPSGVTCTTMPTGGNGSLIFMETLRDHKEFFQITQGRTITIDESLVAHEIAHQFGIEGDDANSSVFNLMDYPDINGGSTNGPLPEFHPQHVNILRRRVTSPGQ